ncbi:MAG: hypothetical protein NTY32_04320 [Bacteroidia bacterium]|nr:hypothetical protein [Bacteroidia bacterium]
MKKKLALLPILLALIASCTGYVSSIPDRDVYFKRKFNTVQLSTFGAYLYVTDSGTVPLSAVDRIRFGGLLIYHAQDNVFYAVDLACPKEVTYNVRISPPVYDMCKCETCGEVYDMTFGQGIPTKGIAKEPLRHYTVSFDENDFILITR